MKRPRRCPYCPPTEPEIDPYDNRECVLNKPLWMVIPAEGVHLHCPVHPEGHHIYGNQITCATPMGPGSQIIEGQHDPSKDLTYDSTRPYGTSTGGNIPNTRIIGTGFTGNDMFKFSM
jgi:hypothetical protein